MVCGCQRYAVYLSPETLSHKPAPSSGNETPGFATVAGMGDLLGYASVSTIDQDASLQVDALTRAGCLRVFVDVGSGAWGDRPELARMLDQLRPADTVVVWRLDRLGRSLPHLVGQVRELEQRGVEFQSLTEQIDTSAPGGRLVFHVFAALAWFERDLVRERTNAGLAAARARGRVGGNSRKLTERQIAAARTMIATGDLTGTEIAATLGVSRSTLYRQIGFI